MEIWRWRQLYHLSVRWPSLSLFHKRGNRRPALSAAGRGPAAGHGAAGRLLPAGQGSLRLYRTLRGGPGRGAFQPGNGRIVFHLGPGHSQILFRMLRKAASCSFRAAVRPSCSGQESGPGLNTLLCTQKPCAGRGRPMPARLSIGALVSAALPDGSIFHLRSYQPALRGHRRSAPGPPTGQ